MLDCNTEVQTASQRESSPNAVSGLRQGSVLDILCPQTKTVTVDKRVEAIGMLSC